MPPARKQLYPIAWLIGRWVAVKAQGKYPTIRNFTFGEEMEFVDNGTEFVQFCKKSWSLSTKTLMHSERGFLRLKTNTNEVAFVVVSSFGLATIEEGTARKCEMRLRCLSVDRDSFARTPHVCELERRYRLNPDCELEYTLKMATTNTPLTEHLRVIYNKCTKSGLMY